MEISYDTEKDLLLIENCGKHKFKSISNFSRLTAFMFFRSMSPIESEIELRAFNLGITILEEFGKKQDSMYDLDKMNDEE